MTGAPANIGRYQVVDRIGRGGMGALYLAWDPNLDRQVAIKVLIDVNDELRKRFSREARSVARLHHPNIVTLYDVGEDDGRPFIAMEYIQGQTLAEVIGKNEPLPIVRKLQLAKELAEGLAFAHQAGVIHRDIKPANIMVDIGGALKILDFGIARIPEITGMTQAGALIGSLNYMSPEQLAGQVVDHRSDIFSVGVVCYELLSYRQAFPGGLDSGVVQRLLQGHTEPLVTVCPTLDPEIARIVHQCLEPDAQKRYQTLASMLKDLARVRLRLASQEPAENPESSHAGPISRRAVDLEELARRRSRQIQAHLKNAQDAFAARNYESTIAECEAVLMLDAEQWQAIELMDRAKTALDVRVRRAEGIRALMGRAHASFDKGLFAEAVAAADAVLALNPDHAEAKLVKARSLEAIEAQAREELARRANACVGEARRRFSENDHTGALDLLARFEPSQEIVSKALEELRTESRRIAEQRRVEAERRAKQQHIEAEVLLARGEIERRQFAGALDRLRTVNAGGGSPEIAALIETAEAGAAERERAEAVARSIAESVAKAAGLFARNDFPAALIRVESALALNPAHEPALALQSKIREGMRIAAERREARERRDREREQAIAAALEQARGATSYEAAVSTLYKALELAPEHAEARRLLAQWEDRVARERADRRRAEEADRAVRERIEPLLESAREALRRDDIAGARRAIQRIRDLEPENLQAQWLSNEIAAVHGKQQVDSASLAAKGDPGAAQVPPGSQKMPPQTAAAKRSQAPSMLEHSTSPVATPLNTYLVLAVAAVIVVLLVLGYFALR